MGIMKTKMTKDIVPEGFTMMKCTAGHLLCREHDPDREMLIGSK